MIVFKNLSQWRQFRRTSQPTTLGFVPTMGALHQGHLQLVKRSVQENSHSLVSIFVNPTQFDNADDLKAYPSNLEADLELLQPLGVDYVLAPNAAQMYPPVGDDRELAPETIKAGPASKTLCGAHRPGHFDGMLTVVLKLLNLARPTRAYFGEKDYQQLKLVQAMVEDFFLEVQIVACPTERQADGLALSSRNQRLTPAARLFAARFPELLKQATSTQQAADQLALAGFEVDYVQDWQDRRLAAVWLNCNGDSKLDDGPKVRLIDNIELRTTL
jgi:pantoate--beta-alanine ligase